MPEKKNVLLAFDTSSNTLSAGLYRRGEKMAGFTSDGFIRHSGSLAPALKDLLQKARLEPADLEAIAVGLGPGSFTGLRVGVTTAKVLSFASGCQLVGVSSLEAMALGAGTEGRDIAIVLDAKKNQVYAASYVWKSGKVRVRRTPHLANRDAFLKKLALGSVVIQKPLVSADWIARLAWDKISAKQFADPVRLEPIYLYPRDCNVTLSKK